MNNYLTTALSGIFFQVVSVPLSGGGGSPFSLSALPIPLAVGSRPLPLEVGPLIQLGGGLEELCKLPQRGPGHSPGRQTRGTSCIYLLKTHSSVGSNLVCVHPCGGGVKNTQT